MQRVIGIDFGTSTTYMNVKRYNGNKAVEDQFSYMPVVFNYGESSGFVSSIVRENEDGTLDFGEKAIEQLEGSKIHKEVKMYLESPDEEKRTEARRITEQFFKFLYETYKQQISNLGSADDEEETIVSYPVKWQLETVRFMLDAARKAGFQNVHGMDEATAAVSAVLCQNTNNKLIQTETSGYLMLVDMGAGTTDMVVCKYHADSNSELKVEMVTSWPKSLDEPTFGGREIDAVLEKYVENYLTKSLIPTLAPQAHELATVPGQAKMWKERNVSFNLAANKSVNTCAYIGAFRQFLSGDFPAFGRTEFEQLAESGLRDYVRLLQGCLADTIVQDDGIVSAGLDIVILTGGHSAWYFAREIIDGTMEGYLEHPSLEMVRRQKARVVNLPNPQTTVSLGLVYSKLPFKMSNKETKSVQSEKSQVYQEDSPLENKTISEKNGSLIMQNDQRNIIEEKILISNAGISQNKNLVVKQTQSDRQNIEYDSSKCPKCGSAIPHNSKNCPMCGRKKLPELTTPYKIKGVTWVKGNPKIHLFIHGPGTLKIDEDHIEYKGYLAKIREIFWMRDIIDVKEIKYVRVPCIEITLRDGNVHTFRSGSIGQNGEDCIRGAVALIQQLIYC